MIFRVYFTHSNKPNESKAYWEYEYKDVTIKSPVFGGRKEAISHLKKSIYKAEEIPSLNESEELFLCVKTEQINNNWQWSVYSTMNSGVTLIESKSSFNSKDDALSDVRHFINRAIDSPITDSAGVLIPNIAFGKDFSEKFDIGDSHPSSEIKF